LLLLEHDEITVAELCAILQAPQSTVSRHLKALSDGEWIRSRAEGTSRFYGIDRSNLGGSTKRLWQLVREQVSTTTTAVQDAQRLQSVLTERRSKSQEFFSSAAGQWDQLRETLFGRHFTSHALLALLDSNWVVGDLGCGSGQVVEGLAPFVRRVIGVDDSSAMLQSARKRLHATDNVEVRRGRLEDLPLESEELDAATCFLELHHVAEPAAAIQEAARVIRPGGQFVIVDMQPHDREQYRRQMGHVWLGFSEEQIGEHMQASGFVDCAARALPADSQASGPTLFVAKGRKAVRSRSRSKT
jgi:ArsR family transcriptional regulator